MLKIGKQRIHRNRNGGKPAECANCGGKGGFRVTFKDNWGKLIVSLCEECANKEYEELQLQSRLNWPAIA